MRLHTRILIPLLRILLALCLVGTGANATADDATKVARQTRQTWHFGDVHFSNDFSGARLNGCEQIGANEFKVIISPENEPINKSPWYAFQVWAGTKRKISVRFVYTYGAHRTRPWLSKDGEKWQRIADRVHAVHQDSGEGTAQFAVGPKPLWIAAQEMIGLKQLGAWTEAKCALPFAESKVIGHSIEGRPLQQLVLSETTNANYVFVIGRQHPPEVTGTIGLMSFVDVVAGNSKLAKKFRQQFQTVVIPLVNPDGVEHGHWRSNLGAVDLNRDWRPFTQPESRAASDAIQTFTRQPGARPFVFLDFHSTHTNLYYAQPDAQPIFPNEFTRRWLAATQKALPHFGFDRDNGHNLGQFTSKAWANETFGIAAITWEFGYSTDRKLIRRAAAVGAEELMRLLLNEINPPR
jgi:hypothetical protein